MTVAELISKLQEFDGDLPVYVRGYEYGVDDVNAVEEIWVDRDRNRGASWAGNHEVDDPKYLDNPEKGVHLHYRIYLQRLEQT